MPTVRMPAQWLGEGGPSVLPSFRPSVTILPDLAGRQVMRHHHLPKTKQFWRSSSHVYARTRIC